VLRRSGSGTRRDFLGIPDTSGLVLSTLRVLLVVVLLAHAGEDRLFCAALNEAQLLLSAMRDASSALDCDLATAFELTPLPCWSMRTTQTGFLHVLGAARVLALLSFGTVGNAQTTLDDAVWASLDCALATDALARTTGSHLEASRFTAFRVRVRDTGILGSS